jgi:hypothetical protein
VHTEPYDKTHATKISWWPRRDVALVSGDRSYWLLWFSCPTLAAVPRTRRNLPTPTDTLPAAVHTETQNQQGKAVGEVFFTADGGLILRSHTYPLLSKQPDFVVEDYLSLEDGGNVVVDRMCCFCTRTGRRAEQLQVVRRSAAAPTSPRWA